MFVLQTEPHLTVPTSEGTLFQLLDSDTVGRTVVLVNTHATNTINYRFQKSADKQTWSDITSVNPSGPKALTTGTAVSYTITEVENFVRVLASGNATAAVAILRYRSYTTGDAFPLVAI